MKGENYGTKSFPDEAEAKKQRECVFPYMPKISILVPLYNTPEEFLREMIESVTGQTYENWELCLADGSDSEHAYVAEIVKEYQYRDKELQKDRILYRKLEQNEGISGNTNQCLTMATGEFIGLFDHDDVLHPSALYEYVKVINEKQADYIYCDETTFKSGNINHMLTMHFKPDYAIDNLRANNYICHFSVFARQLLDGTELFRTKFDGSQDHDMILRLTDRAKNVVHVPKLLYYWRSHPGSVASDINAKPYAIQSAKDEYHALPADKQTATRKVSIVMGKSSELRKLEADCDKQVDAIVEKMRTLLQENGQSTELADQIKASYKAQKSAMYASLKSQLLG